MLGYYFKINHIDKYKINEKPLYAAIKLDEKDVTIGDITTGEFKYIQRDIDSIEGNTSSDTNNKIDLDNEGNFYGLKLVYIHPEAPNLSSLRLFDSNGNVPFESQIKLITDKTHRSISIDDGDLDT